MTPSMIVEVSSQIKIKKPLSKDEFGFYKNVPLGVLDFVSRNNTLYESTSFKACMKNENSQFYKRLQQGVLIGEFDHPDLSMYDMSKTVDRERAGVRFVRLDPAKEAMIFRAIRIRDVELKGKKYPMIFGDLKGSGPYGHIIEQKMEDPSINLAFSLRTLTKDTPMAGYLKREAMALVTFDGGMPGGGFEEAAKDRIHEYSQEGYEKFDYDVVFGGGYSFSSEFTKRDAQLAGAAAESLLSFEELRDIYGTIEIKQGSNTIGSLDGKGNVISKQDSTTRKCTFDTFFNV